MYDRTNSIAITSRHFSQAKIGSRACLTAAQHTPMHIPTRVMCKRHALSGTASFENACLHTLRPAVSQVRPPAVCTAALAPVHACRQRAGAAELQNRVPMSRETVLPLTAFTRATPTAPSVRKTSPCTKLHEIKYCQLIVYVWHVLGMSNSRCYAHVQPARHPTHVIEQHLEE